MWRQGYRSCILVAPPFRLQFTLCRYCIICFVHAALDEIKKFIEEEIRSIRSKLLSTEEKFTDLKWSVDYFSAKYDKLLKIQSSNDKTVKLTADVKIVKQDLSIAQKQRKKLKQRKK